jgi:AraC-like DNA-binding protein
VAAPVDLAYDVACSWRATIAGSHRLVPDGCVDVLWLGTGAMWVCGPELAAWEFSLPPGLQAVGVRLRPGAARRLLRTDVHHLTDRRARFEDVFGTGVERSLSEQMGEARDPLPVLEGAVRSWVHGAPSAEGTDAGIVQAMLAPRPRPVAEVARDVGLSARQMHRRSLRLFGYGPTTLARIVRFQRFVLLGQRTEGRTLAELAVASGYHDQAHLGRDCRSLTGLAPSAFLAGHDRTFPDTSDPY